MKLRAAQLLIPVLQIKYPAFASNLCENVFKRKLVRFEF